MPWNPTTKIMTAPLNLNTNGDIQQASGVNSGDLGKCFRDGGWNKWAKYKPMKSGKITPLTEAELKVLDYGLTVSKYTSMSGIIAAINTGTEWAYTPPAGGSTERFRFFDLLKPGAITSTGYRGDANCFFAYSEVPTRATQGGGGCVLRVNWQASDLKEGSLSTADLNTLLGDMSIPDMYVGALMRRGTGNYYKTSSSTVGSNSYMTEIPLSDNELTTIGSGTVSVYLFLAVTREATLLTSGIDNSLRQGVIALPGQGVESMSIVSAGYYISVTNLSAIYGTGDNDIPPGSLQVKCNLAYASTPAAQATNVTVRIYTSDEHGGTDVLLNGYTHSEATLQLTTTRQVWTDFINNTLRVSYLDYVTAILTFTIGGASVTQSYSRKVTDGTIPPPID